MGVEEEKRRGEEDEAAASGKSDVAPVMTPSGRQKSQAKTTEEVGPSYQVDIHEIIEFHVGGICSNIGTLLIVVWLCVSHRSRSGM